MIAAARLPAEFADMLGRPVPTPAAIRPFTRNSTLEDLEATRVGRLLSSIVVREGLKRSAAEFPDPDDATLAMVRAMLREGPARMLVMMGDGVISFPQLDALLDALDGRWGRLGGNAVRQLRRLVRRGDSA